MGGLLGCSLVALLLAGSGLSAHPVATTVQDDALLLHRSPVELRRSLRQLSELGADYVRITAGWSAIAPARRPAGFDASDPRTYPDGAFDSLDRAVVEATRAGLKVQLDVAFWAPRWAVARHGPGRGRDRYMPDPRQFGLFAHAVAQRYSGSFRHLPAVRLWTTWNEPNHPSFLLPQFRDGKPYAPRLYRLMHEAAYEAIKSVSGANTVLVGGLSSFAPTGGIPPLAFLRDMVADGPVHADGLALHPYSLDTPPGQPSANPDDARIGDLARVDQTLAALGVSWPIYLTEYGYETNPPDPTARFSPAQQSDFLGWATFLAQRDPHVVMFGQFLLRDIRPGQSGHTKRSRRYWSDWQTGLLYADGRPKPAAQAFKMPLYGAYAVGPDGQPALVLYGGVRPGDGRKVVRVERQDPTSGLWSGVQTAGTQCDNATDEFFTDGDGFFTRTAPWQGPGRYRLGWRHGGIFEYGAPVDVDDTAPLVVSSSGQPG